MRPLLINDNLRIVTPIRGQRDNRKMFNVIAALNVLELSWTLKKVFSLPEI